MRVISNLWLAALSGGLSLLSCCLAKGAEPEIVAVEEDWVIAIAEPNKAFDAPQITLGMLPFGSESDVLMQLDINHGTFPAFSAGGLQIRCNIDDECYSYSRIFEGMRLDDPGEVLRITQRIELVDGGFRFGVVRGESETWGHFGGESTFTFIKDVSGRGLQSYDYHHSLANSEVCFSGNRVSGIQLETVRVHTADGQTATVNIQSEPR